MLKIKDITSFRHNKLLFQDLSFELNPGEILQIVGNNGVGKTSLLRIVAGLLMPQKGVIYWLEKPIKQCLPHYFKNLFYMGHDNGIKANLTIRENLLFDCRYPQPKEQVLNDALNLLNLNEQHSKLCHHLSQGQKQRVALAKLLLTPATLWILDEPFSSLDQIGIEKIQRLFHQNLSSGGCILLSTHQSLTLADLSIRSLRLLPPNKDLRDE